MEQYINDFIKMKEAQGMVENSLKSYRRNIEEFCTDFKKPSEIKEKAIIEYFSSVQQSTLGNRSKCYRIWMVRAFCEYLMSINVLILNAKCLMVQTKIKNSLPKTIWSEEEMDLLIKSLGEKRHRRLKAIVELSYSCGLRLREIIHADIFDLNLSESTLLIKESKGKDRLLPVTNRAIQAIQVYLEDRQKIKVKNSALFVTYKGERMKEYNVQRSLLDLTYRRKLGKDLTIHCIRNSIATQLLRRGMDIVLISKFLGHNHLTTTTIYTRVVNNDLKLMIDEFHPRNSFNLE